MPAETRIVPTVQNPDVVTCNILIEGTAVSREYHLTNLTIHNEINKIPRASLNFFDGDPAKQTFELSESDEFAPGKKIEIQLGYHGDATTVFKGIVITNTQRITSSYSELVIECKDETVKMTVNKSNRHFNDILDSDIVTQLLSDNNITDTDVDDSQTQHEQLVQSNVTDWDFMISRLDINSMICVINNGTVTVKKPKLDEDAKLELIYGADIIELYADMDARSQTTSVKTMSWDFENQQVRVVESEDPNAPDEGEFSRDELASVNNQPLEIRTSATLTEQETQDIVNAKKLRQELSKIRASVRYQGIDTVIPGDFITLSGLGKNFNGKAFVSAVQHDFSEGDWTSVATLGMNEQFFTEQVNPEHPASPAGQSSSLQGLQIGIVTGITDDAGQYRVKVRFPMVNDQDDGVYARVATLDAGDKRGTFFRPEMDDEVIVGFMNDDPRNPVVLGMLHSSAKSAPIEPSDGNPEKGYVSRNGIKLIFNDDKKSIHIETPGNRVFEMDDDAGSITVKDDNGNKMVIDSNGISIESASDLTIKAGTSISISAPDISIKADTSLSAEASGSASLSSSGTMEIKGSIVKIN
jgi:Rhs element Vgr protein